MPKKIEKLKFFIDILNKILNEILKRSQLKVENFGGGGGQFSYFKLLRMSVPLFSVFWPSFC